MEDPQRAIEMHKMHKEAIIISNKKHLFKGDRSSEQVASASQRPHKNHYYHTTNIIEHVVY